MTSDFSRCLSLLRQEKGASQRSVAKDLGISQALLSHYENGVREPGLAFVIKACNYYNVSADFLLGRTLSRDGTTIAAEELFDLLGKTGKKESINAAADYLGTAIYKLFRHLYRADGTQNEDFFSVPARQFTAGVPFADMICAEADYTEALAAHVKDKGTFPPMNNDALMENYPGLYQSLLQIIHNTGERINRRTTERRTK